MECKTQRVQNIMSNIQLQARLSQLSGSHETDYTLVALQPAGQTGTKTSFGGAQWDISLSLQPLVDQPDAVEGRMSFRVTQGAAHEVAVAVEWPVNPWSRDNFVLLPAATYNGNRFACRPYRYPPMVHEAGDIGLDAPICITDVPRLNVEDGMPSRLQVLTGDVTTPCIGFYAPHEHEAYLWLTEQRSQFGNHALTVEENAQRDLATLRIEAPGVRRDTLYSMANTSTPSWDHAAEWTAGTQVTLVFRIYRFPAQSVQDLYHRFAQVRKDLAGSVTQRHEFPFSEAWHVLEEKHNRENWSAAGYYRVGTPDPVQDSRFQDWQVGWVGGGMVPFPMLIAGLPLSRQRAIQNLEWMFTHAQYPSGLFHAIQHEGVPSCDGFETPGTDTWVMVRKEADALYFLLKTYQLLKGQDAAWQLPAHWEAGTRRLADLFVNVFRRYGQLGQYLDCYTGEVMVGGSTASAMAAGALAQAGQYFAQPDYLQVAELLATQLDARDVQAGVTVGGPGEILKCPDSESAFAMLESFIVLYEVTGEAHWLARAEAMAEQCMTWCASYDYVFPPQSWLGKLGTHAAGSVWANVQNKHCAPGICTLSGDSLFKLFRYTGKRLYLDQIQETAHNLTQYLSRADRPVGDPQIMKPGWMCERVNFSDWEGRDNIGGSLFGSCWCEVSLMLTTVEIPGIYVQPDLGLLCVFDHVEAQIVEHSAAQVVLQVHNPTTFDADVRVFAEASVAATKVLGQAAAIRWPQIHIAAGETLKFVVNVSGAVTPD
jgi:hypothetical protein